MTRRNLGFRALCLIVAYLGAQAAFAYYDPSTGRFLNRDPLEEDIGGLNLYAYVENQPISVVDPIGGCSTGGSCDTCCCAETLTWKQLGTVGAETDIRGLWGHDFSVTGTVSFHTVGAGEQAGRCKFEWWEHSEYPGTAIGQQHADRWYDAYSLRPDLSMFGQVRDYESRDQPCNGQYSATIPDQPAIPIGPAYSNAERNLYIGIKVSSAPNCNCKNSAPLKLILYQKLTMQGGQGNHRNLREIGAFPRPPGSPPGW